MSDLTDQIVAKHASDLEIEVSEALSRGRKAVLVECRRRICRELRYEYGFPLEAIGAVIGRDHTTVLHLLNTRSAYGMAAKLKREREQRAKAAERQRKARYIIAARMNYYGHTVAEISEAVDCAMNSVADFVASGKALAPRYATKKRPGISRVYRNNEIIRLARRHCAPEDICKYVQAELPAVRGVIRRARKSGLLDTIANPSFVSRAYGEVRV